MGPKWPLSREFEAPSVRGWGMLYVKYSQLMETSLSVCLRDGEKETKKSRSHSEQ